MELTAFQKQIGLILSGDDTEHHHICYELLFALCRIKDADLPKAMQVATGAVVNFRVDGIIDELAKGEKGKFGRRTPWSRSKIKAVEKILGDFEEEAVTQLTSILLAGNENAVSGTVLQNLGLAMLYLWGLRDEATIKVKVAAAAKRITVQSGNSQKRPPKDIA